MKTTKKIKPKRPAILQSSDKLLAYGGIALGTALLLLLLALRLYQPLGLAVTIQATSAGYLILREHMNESTHRKEQLERISLQTPLPVITISIIALVALGAIWVSADSLRRPLWVFMFLAIVPGFAIAQANRLPRIQVVHQSLRFQLVILAVAIVLTSVTTFPYNGGDTWAYLHDARIVTENHTIGAISGAYHDYPLYPAILSILSTLTNFGAADIARFLNVFATVVCVLLTYSLASRYYNSHSKALIAALFLLGSKWFIYWMTMAASMTLTAPFFSILTAILFRRLYKKTDPKEVAALFLVSGIVPFFHPVGAVSAIVLFAGFWGLQALSLGRRLFEKQSSLIGLVVFVVVITLAQWMYFGDFIFDRTVKALASAILRDGDPIQLAASHRDVLVYTLDQLNFYCLLGFAGLGIMRQAHLRTDKLSLYAGIIGLLFIGFGYATQAISLLAVLPHRWFLFGTLLLIFPAASVLATVLRSKNRWNRVGAICILVFYFLTGLGNTEVNRDRPFYGREVTPRYELTSSEYAGLLRLQDLIHRKNVQVRVDFRLWDYLKFVPNNDTVGYWKQIQLDGFDGIFPMRDIYFHQRLLVDSPSSALEFQCPAISQFYDSGDMQLLDHTNDIGMDH